MNPKMIRSVLWCAVSACALQAVEAQMERSDIPLWSPEEKAAVARETEELYKSAEQPVRDAVKSTVWVFLDRHQVALGTVIGDGAEVITKWSEVAFRRGALRVVTADGSARSATIRGVYDKEDLAILKLTGSPLTPVRWSSAEEPQIGHFLVAASPRPEPAGFGVVSVAARNLRESDQAYLGVLADPSFDGPGARVARIEANSGARQAGLRAGDVILALGDRRISGMLELRNALLGRNPDQTVKILYSRGGKESSAEVKLGRRPELPKFSGDRLAVMERLGGDISRVRDGFSHVIQTDMALSPAKVGGPVADLQGRVVGILIARADRTRSFVIPAGTLVSLLKTPPTDPVAAAQAMVSRRNQPRPLSFAQEEDAPTVVPQMDEDATTRLRGQFEMMRRMMEQMREEMDRLEGR